MGEIKFILGDGNSGRKEPDGDDISGMIFIANTAQDPLPIDLNKHYELNSLQDAIDLGFDEAFDSGLDLFSKPHYNISEYFRFNPNGTLFIYFIESDTATYVDLFQGSANIPQFLKYTGGKIKQLAVIGMDNDTVNANLKSTVISAAPIAQQLADSEFDEGRPIVFLLPGWAFTGTVTTAHDFSAEDLKNVFVTIAHDKEYAWAFTNAAYLAYSNKQPATATTLGMIAARSVHENIGWTGGTQELPGDLSDTAEGKMLEARFTSTQLAEDYKSDWKALSDKGYVFPVSYPGQSGTYFYSDRNCASTSSDYNSIRIVRTVNKAVRLLNAEYFPYINSPIEIDPDTGQIAAITAKSLENEGNDALDYMVGLGELSGFRVYIDPEQDVLSNGKIIVNVWVVPIGCAEEIEVQFAVVPQLPQNL